MSKPFGVLLVPASAHDSLLDVGSCGARPPMAALILCHDISWSRWRPCNADWHEQRTEAKKYTGFRRALVLGWEDKPVRLGSFQLDNIDPIWHSWSFIQRHVRGAMTGEADRIEALHVLLKPWGSVVLIDTEGREVSDE